LNYRSIPGAVGYPLNTPSRPQCPDSQVLSPAMVEEGALPPGITLQPDGLLTGVPTDAGHWHAMIRLARVLCGDTVYPDDRVGLIFGWMADRYGRRIPLMIDVTFYSIVEVLSGLAPDYSTFLALRVLYGIAMGGEWGVGASLAMEVVPAARRGLLSGLLQEGYAIGYLLAAAAYFVVFPALGWRALFILGGAPALLVLYIRSRVPESPAWQCSRPDPRRIAAAVAENFGRFLYLILFMTMLNLMSHGTQDMYPTFLEKERGLGPR